MLTPNDKYNPQIRNNLKCSSHYKLSGVYKTPFQLAKVPKLNTCTIIRTKVSFKYTLWKGQVYIRHVSLFYNTCKIVKVKKNIFNFKST